MAATFKSRIKVRMTPKMFVEEMTLPLGNGMGDYVWDRKYFRSIESLARSVKDDRACGFKMHLASDPKVVRALEAI